jgi:hypothetical protein
MYRLCYVRGPAGIIVELAEQIGQARPATARIEKKQRPASRKTVSRNRRSIAAALHTRYGVVTGPAARTPAESSQSPDALWRARRRSLGEQDSTCRASIRCPGRAAGTLLDELIERHGPSAVVTAYPVMLDSGVTYRWEILIDGEQVSDVSVHAHGIRGRPNEVVLVMVHGKDEIEIAQFSIERPEPASIVRTLGDLRRKT